MRINILDLFSGIGGFSQGLTQAGFTINKHYTSEIDKHAKAIYKRQFPKSVDVGDVRHVRASDLERVDAITFGSPCQDFSIAGKRKGMAGDRSSLISEAIRLIDECRPKFFIWENVKGTFSSNAGEDFWAIIKAFVDIGGYRLEWQLLNTSWFLPQNRERIYLVGTLGNECGREIFPIRETSKIYNRTSKNKKEIHANNRTALTQQARQFSSWNGDFVKVRSNTKQGYEVAQEGDSINYAVANSKTRRGRVGKQKAQTLDTACCQAVITPNRQEKRQNGRRFKENGEPAFTLNCQDQHGIMINKERIRRLTEIECERLQGFSDNWTKFGNYDGEVKEVSSSQRYKCLGNAVTVNVVQAVGEQILQSIKSNTAANAKQENGSSADLSTKKL